MGFALRLAFFFVARARGLAGATAVRAGDSFSVTTRALHGAGVDLDRVLDFFFATRLAATQIDP